MPAEAGWSICSGWRRLWSALWVPSCPVDTWHFKRGPAALSPDEVTPRRWGSAALPSVCMTSAHWGGAFKVYLGSDSSSGDLGIKQLASVLLGRLPQTRNPSPSLGEVWTWQSPQKETEPATFSHDRPWAGVIGLTENSATTKLMVAGAGVQKLRPHPHVGALSSALWSLQAQWIRTRHPQLLDLKILYIEREIEYIRDIFGKELVYAMPVWNLLGRQF